MYMLLLPIAIAVATFVENDFGTSSAHTLFFEAGGSKFLPYLVLPSCTTSTATGSFPLKWEYPQFPCLHHHHLIGICSDPLFWLRRNDAHQRRRDIQCILSTEQYLQFKVIKGGKSYSFDEPVLFSAKGNNKFSQAYQIGSDLVEVKLNNFMPNPMETAVEDANGVPMIKVVIGGMGGRKNYM